MFSVHRWLFNVTLREAVVLENLYKYYEQSIKSSTGTGIPTKYHRVVPQFITIL